MTSPIIDSSVLPAIPTNTPRRIVREQGIASLTFKGDVFRFRTNPNSIRWSYTPNVRVDPTYGGRVIQLLSVKIDDLVVQIEAGQGRWDYYRTVSEFMRRLLVEQKDGTTATFEYTTRGWKLNVYVVNIPYEDDFHAVTRPIELSFKVQEDVSGVMSQNSLSQELKNLQDGIGWKKSKYNQPDPSDGTDGESGWLGLGQTADQLTGAIGDLAQAITGSDAVGSAIASGGGLASLFPGIGVP